MSTLHPDITAAIQRALSEDVGSGDVTSTAIIPDHMTMQGRLIAKQAGIMAGFDVVQAVCAAVDERIILQTHIAEGARVSPLQVVAEINGPAQSLLTAERT
ncbi:MAG: nicotinate-nucleotide diphosphorylase (carboxylating), partial [Roseiflexaceae bacterium]